MAGHSKWANTKRRKAAVDSKRGKIFSVLSKEITIAARSGGGDPDSNARLRTLLVKARYVNMPADNIERAVKKGTGELAGQTIEELVYEGYLAGVGLIIELTTDNKNRSASEIRSTFTKHGGSQAVPGALAFNFSKHGQFIIARDAIEEDRLMELALEAGADDIKTEDEHYEVICPQFGYDALANVFEKAGLQPESSAVAWIPSSLVTIDDPDTARRLLKLVDALEAWDDVSYVYTNHDFTDAVKAALDND